MRRREQRQLEEQQEEINKWQKKIKDRQREDEEFKVYKIHNNNDVGLYFIFLLLITERTNEKKTSFIVQTKFSWTKNSM